MDVLFSPNCSILEAVLFKADNTVFSVEPSYEVGQLPTVLSILKQGQCRSPPKVGLDGNGGVQPCFSQGWVPWGPQFSR